MRYRQVHNVWGLYAGPNNATGYHFADYNGERHNNPQLTIFDENLLKQIDRVNSFQYGIGIERTNLTQLGKRDLIDRSIVNRPVINFGFSYYMVGVRNEDRLGFTVNYPDVTGKPILDREISFFNNFTGWNTDCRNIFLAVAPDSTDINNNIYDINHSGKSLSPTELYVLGFGNSYLESYSVQASVGSFPLATVGYLCENVLILKSGSGAQIPAITTKSGSLVSGVKFSIPSSESIVSPSVIRPGDITLKLGSIQSGFYETNEAIFGFNSSGLAIQGFDFKINLDREPLRSIGHNTVIDRRVNFPIVLDMNISSIIDNHYSGNLSHYVNKNHSYDILVNMYTPSCQSQRDIAIQYKIKNAKFDGATYDHQLNSTLVGNFRFSAEIDINNPSKEMFVSGSLNAPFPQFPFNYLVLEQNGAGFLLTEDGNLLIVSEN